ncbi:MAG: hypothetical protein GY906_25460 [bacterium]|nr:hypothetical protein [bacterium]
MKIAKIVGPGSSKLMQVRATILHVGLLILGLEPVLDLASIVLRRYGDRPTHPIWYRRNGAEGKDWAVEKEFTIPLSCLQVC